LPHLRGIVQEFIMIQSPYTRESVNYGPGYAYDGGGYGGGGWGIAGGFAFLFLVFIIFGFAFFHRGDQDKIHDSVREHGGHNHGSALAQAEFRGEQRIRTADIWEATQQNARRLEHLEISTARGFDAAVCATREGVKDIELYGDNVGFRAKQVVYPNPCERHEGHEHHCRDIKRTVVTPYTPPREIAVTEDVCRT
jgi:hypothetical protein